MKKHLKSTILLLTAALFFAGCSSPSSSGSGSDNGSTTSDNQSGGASTGTVTDNPGTGGSTTTGGEATISTNAIELSDGDWIIETEMEMPDESGKASTMKVYEEVTIAGDTVTINKAIVKEGNNEEDVTEETKKQYKKTSDLVNVNNHMKSTSEGMGITLTESDYTIKKNANNTKYVVTINKKMDITSIFAGMMGSEYAEYFSGMDPAAAAELQALLNQGGTVSSVEFDLKAKITYTKKS